jgi:hypothetical protein
MSIEKSIQKLLAVVAPPTTLNTNCDKLFNGDERKPYVTSIDICNAVQQSLPLPTYKECTKLKQNNTKKCKDNDIFAGTDGWKNAVVMTPVKVTRLCEKYAQSILAATNTAALTDAQKTQILQDAKCGCYNFALYSQGVGNNNRPTSQTIGNPLDSFGVLYPGQVEKQITLAFYKGCSISQIYEMCQTRDAILAAKNLACGLPNPNPSQQ